MKYVQKNGNEQRVYEVTTDGLTEVLKSVMKTCCYKSIGSFDLNLCGWSIKIDPKTNKIISGAKLPCGVTEFVDIKSYRYYTYDEPNDSVVIDGTKIVAPRLAYILQGLISGKKQYSTQKDWLDQFMEYANDPELIPIDERIAQQNEVVNSISNSEPKAKIEALEELKELLDRKKKLEYASPESLRGFYDYAKELIQFRLLSKTITYDDDNALPYKEVLESAAKVGPGLG
jgi:hypothetical protein